MGGILLQVGVSTAGELGESFGHMACTLGGVNFESRGHRGCLTASAARGATNPLFRHHFHRVLDDHQAQLARHYAAACVGQPYVLGKVPMPTHGGDCSGYVAGMVCTADGKTPAHIFGTATFASAAAGLGFASGLGGAVAPTAQPIGVADRPYPGFPIKRGSDKHDHIRWLQARLEFAAHGHHDVLGGRHLDVDGDFGPDTEKVLVAFQKAHGLQGLGMAGPKTWALLNDVR